MKQAAALGVVHAHISGGEPLVRRDLAEIVAAAQRIYCQLVTSGVGLSTARLAELAAAGIDSVQQPGHGLRAKGVADPPVHPHVGQSLSGGQPRHPADALMQMGQRYELRCDGRIRKDRRATKLAAQWTAVTVMHVTQGRRVCSMRGRRKSARVWVST